MLEKIHQILGIDDIFDAPSRLMEILLDKAERERVFLQFLDMPEFKISEDFWHEYFQQEMAQRKELKQDFTPMSVAKLCALLANQNSSEAVPISKTETTTHDGCYFEAAAGTGGMMIAKWDEDRKRHSPLNYNTSDYLYVCEELSDRAFPFLVFNMAIRGMNGVAVQCDSLTRGCYGVFLIQNDSENAVGFSSVNVMPYNEETEKFFDVSFYDDKTYERKYSHRVESFKCEVRDDW